MEMNDQLARVAPAAWGLRRMLGGTWQASDGAAEDKQTPGIDQTLESMKEFVAKFEPELAQVRQRTAKLKSWTLDWITPAAVVISVICFWFALSQIIVLCYACSWWKHAGRPVAR
jgi:hypothetical protein